MKILLDHCVDRNLSKLFPTHEIKSAAEMGWENLQNGDLLVEASKAFDVFVTVDKNFRYQQNLITLPIPILELYATTNRLKERLPPVTSVSAALDATRSHRFVSLHNDGRIETLAERHGSEI